MTAFDLCPDIYCLNSLSMAVLSTAQNKSIYMSIDFVNSTENWLDKGIFIKWIELYSWIQFTHLFMGPSVAQLWSLFILCGQPCLDIILFFFLFFPPSIKQLIE